MKWLKTVIVPNPDGTEPATILLSHHQYCSAFDNWYTYPAEQLKPLLKQKSVLWFWGHEHRFAIYDQFKAKGGIHAWGRCVGHGGMPVNRGVLPDNTDCNCLFYDDRHCPNHENMDAGYNGFVDLAFNGQNLDVNYYDLHDTKLLTETWSCDPAGSLIGPKFTFPPA
jgi:hypothetical protein